MKLHPQYITDSAGNQLVVLTKEEYDAIIEELEEAADLRLYDEAMKDGSPPVPIEEAFKIIEQNRKPFASDL